MSNASAAGTYTSSDHLLALKEHEVIAGAIARGATHDFIANGNLNRLWMYCDALRQCEALGYGPAFAAAYHVVREIGVKDPRNLPDREVWQAICGKPYVAQLSGELTNKLGDKAPWLAGLLSGKLVFPYEELPPLSPDSFEQAAEILRGNLAARLSEREVLAKLDGIKLFQFVETVSLGREEDAKQVDDVRELVVAAIARRRSELTTAIAKMLRSRKISDYHNPRAFTEIKLHELFDRWWNDISGDLLKIAVEHGSRGQSASFQVPPYRSEILSYLEWTNAPKRLTHSGTGHGAYYAGMGTGIGAAGGSASSGIHSYAVGSWTMAKYPAALKALGFGAAVGGAGLGAAALLVWFGFKYWRESATAAYEVFVRGVVGEIETALTDDFMARYRAYVGRVTHADNLKAQNALDTQIKLAGDRLVAANIYAQPERRERFRVI